MGPIALAEGALADRVFVATDEPLPLPETNVFGDPVVVMRGQALVLGPQLADAAAAGKRATLVAHARDLSGLREVFHGIRARRLGTVLHVLADAGSGDALPLADLGWVS